jgi:hypothetical protein
MSRRISVHKLPVMALQARSAPKTFTPLRLPVIARVAMLLEIFLGLGALFGGGALILAPDGHLLGMPTTLLAGSPFTSFLVPGIILFTLVGLAPLLAAAITGIRSARRGGRRSDADRLGIS